MTEKEYEALITTANYKYYKDYVEDLEKAHDQLLIENEELQQKLNESESYQAISRYRQMAKDAIKERDAAKKELANLKNEIRKGGYRKWQ